MCYVMAREAKSRVEIGEVTVIITRLARQEMQTHHEQCLENNEQYVIKS